MKMSRLLFLCAACSLLLTACAGTLQGPAEGPKATAAPAVAPAVFDRDAGWPAGVSEWSQAPVRHVRLLGQGASAWTVWTRPGSEGATGEAIEGLPAWPAAQTPPVAFVSGKPARWAKELQASPNSQWVVLASKGGAPSTRIVGAWHPVEGLSRGSKLGKGPHFLVQVRPEVPMADRGLRVAMTGEGCQDAAVKKALVWAVGQETLLSAQGWRAEAAQANVVLEVTCEGESLSSVTLEGRSAPLLCMSSACASKLTWSAEDGEGTLAALLARAAGDLAQAVWLSREAPSTTLGYQVRAGLMQEIGWSQDAERFVPKAGTLPEDVALREVEEALRGSDSVRLASALEAALKREGMFAHQRSLMLLYQGASAGRSKQPKQALRFYQQAAQGFASTRSWKRAASAWRTLARKTPPEEKAEVLQAWGQAVQTARRSGDADLVALLETERFVWFAELHAADGEPPKEAAALTRSALEATVNAGRFDLATQVKRYALLLMPANAELGQRLGHINKALAYAQAAGNKQEMALLLSLKSKLQAAAFQYELAEQSLEDAIAFAAQEPKLKALLEQEREALKSQ